MRASVGILVFVVLCACGGKETTQQVVTSSSTGVGGHGSVGGAGGSTSSSGAAGGSAGGEGGTGGGVLAEPAVFRTPDPLAVCSPTPAQPCTPSDASWLASEYGSTVTRADAAGGVAYRLVAFVEREGPSNIDVLLVDEQAMPLVGVPIAFYFSSAPETSRPDEWYPNKVTALTEADGTAGFALGSGAYLPCCGCGGPHAIWVSQPGATVDTTVPSDLADALGMLGGTNHRHLDLIFQRTEPPPAPAPVDAVVCPLP